MTKREEEIFRYAMALYDDQWKRNQYNRDNYDEDLEYYRGYRNHQKYPLAYNEVFNRILPLIYTIMSRFMDQIYQTGNIVSVKPRKSRDIENAKAVESVLNFQLENMNSLTGCGGSYNIMLSWFFNAITFGTGILKAYWKKEERISPRRIALPLPNFDRLGNFQGYDVKDFLSMENQVVYDQPYLEVLHNKICVPHPQYKSIHEMPGFFCVYRRSLDYVKKMAEAGQWKNIKEIGISGSGSSIYTKDTDETYMKSIEMEGAEWREELKHERRVDEIDIIEGYLKLILEDAPYEVGSGIKIKGREEECIVHIGNYHTLLSVQKNIYGIRPFFDIGCYMSPELFWDLGIVRLSKGIQEQVNNLGNLRMQNAMMHVNQMLRVDPESEIDPDFLVWRPFGIVPAYQGEIEPILIPDYNSNIFMEQQTFFEETIQDIAGMYDYNKGVPPSRAERVGTVYSIQSMGEARAKLMLMSMDHRGIRPLLRYMMILNTFHLPSGFEYRISDGTQSNFSQIFGDDIHPDFDFAARYTAMEPALGKQFRIQNLLQLAPVFQQNPWINQYYWVKTLLELADVREAGYLLKTPEQFAQEQQQAMQQQMGAMQAQKQLETESNIMESNQDFQEDSALSHQEFKQDLVLEALKLNAVDEKASEGVRS